MSNSSSLQDIQNASELYFNARKKLSNDVNIRECKRWNEALKNNSVWNNIDWSGKLNNNKTHTYPQPAEFNLRPGQTMLQCSMLHATL